MRRQAERGDGEVPETEEVVFLDVSCWASLTSHTIPCNERLIESPITQQILKAHYLRNAQETAENSIPANV